MDGINQKVLSQAGNKGESETDEQEYGETGNEPPGGKDGSRRDEDVEQEYSGGLSSASRPIAAATKLAEPARPVCA